MFKDKNLKAGQKEEACLLSRFAILAPSMACGRGASTTHSGGEVAFMMNSVDKMKPRLPEYPPATIKVYNVKVYLFEKIGMINSLEFPLMK